MHACERRYGRLDEWDAAPRRPAAAAAAAAAAPSSTAAPRQVSSLLAAAVGALPSAPRPAAAVAAVEGAAPACVEPAWGRERVFDESAAGVLATLVRAAGAATVGVVSLKEERRAQPLPFNTVSYLVITPSTR